MDDAMPPMPPMGDEPPMDGGMPPEPPTDGNDPLADGADDGQGSDDDELMNIINGLSVEDKAAVKKYAESMADNSSDGEDAGGMEEPPMGGEEEAPMPMESRAFINSMVNEISNELLNNGKKGTKRHEKNITNSKVSKRNPFVSNR